MSLKVEKISESFIAYRYPYYIRLVKGAIGWAGETSKERNEYQEGYVGVGMPLKLAGYAINFSQSN